MLRQNSAAPFIVPGPLIPKLVRNNEWEIGFNWRFSKFLRDFSSGLFYRVKSRYVNCP